MNPRIQELLFESNIFAKNSDGKVDTTKVHLNKFAELIVREMCILMEQAEDYCYDCFDASERPTEYIEWLRDWQERFEKHFGVESTSIKVGSRVKVVSGFNVGAKGTVSYIEPTGRMWVMRDGASTDVFYHPEEVIGVEE